MTDSTTTTICTSLSSLRIASPAGDERCSPSPTPTSTLSLKLSNSSSESPTSQFSDPSPTHQLFSPISSITTSTTNNAGIPSTSTSTSTSTSVTFPSSESSSTSSKNAYALAQYWNARYAKTRGLFDWYIEYDCLIPIFNQYHITNDIHILNVGCGNSQLSEDMYKAGYRYITNIDISDVVIESMISRYPASSHPEMSWYVMDATDMSTFANHTFDLIIEKGTIDALTCSSEHDTSILSIISESHRVLRPSGHFILITHSAPDQRIHLLDPYSWSIRAHRVAYSASALMIRALRSQLNGRALSNVTPEEFARAATTVKQILEQVQTDIQGITDFSGDYEHVTPDQANQCWVYVCTKAPSISASISTPTSTSTSTST